MNHLGFTANRKKSIVRPDLVYSPSPHSPKTVIRNGTDPAYQPVRRNVVSTRTAVMAHHRTSVHKSGTFHLYPQPYLQYLLQMREAIAEFKAHKRKHEDVNKKRRDEAAASSTGGVGQDLYPPEVMERKRALEPYVKKAKENGHDAWIAYPARFIVDGKHQYVEIKT